MNLENFCKQPIFFRRNRVKRVYTGGKLFADFLGDPPIDNYYPEEWLASTVIALNKNSDDPYEGLSFIEGTDFTLKELITNYQQEVLGGRDDLGMLVKYLDSAIRLPIQAHPDPEFSKLHFNSHYGKTEMWLILATREDACIYFGFKEEMTKEEFKTYINRSKEDKTVFDSLLNRYEVKPSEAYLIPAKMVHAIGYGCLILEVQEPTDFTIQPEYWCGDYQLDEYEMYLGLDPDISLDCFDYTYFGPSVIQKVKKEPVLLHKDTGLLSERLISYEDTPCFSVNRHQLNKGSYPLVIGAALYIVTKGQGEIKSCHPTGDSSLSDFHRHIQMGDYFLIPESAKNNYTVVSDSSIELIECLGPQKSGPLK